MKYAVMILILFTVTIVCKGIALLTNSTHIEIYNMASNFALGALIAREVERYYDAKG